MDVKEVHVAAEGVDGRRTSDHSPLVAYCNFKANAKIGGVDTSNRVFEAASAEKKYTFDIDAGTGVTYDVYDGTRLIGTGSSSAPSGTSTVRVSVVPLATTLPSLRVVSPDFTVTLSSISPTLTPPKT